MTTMNQQQPECFRDDFKDDLEPLSPAIFMLKDEINKRMPP